MAQTTWLPRYTTEKKKWLLTDGSVVTEPDTEETSTGRKVRVKNTNLSAFSRDIDDLIIKAVRAVAKTQGADVWMPIHDAEQAVERTLGFVPSGTMASLHALKSTREAKTQVWWRFCHPTLPIEAYLVVEAGFVRPTITSDLNQHVKGRIVAPLTRPNVQDTYSEVVSSEAWAVPTMSASLDWDLRRDIEDFARTNPPANHLVNMLGTTTLTQERTLVEDILRRVRLGDEIETIQIPDLRDPAQPGWLELELQDSNVNGEFITDLVEYLEGTPSVTKALNHYQDLQTTLRTLGLNLEDKSEDDFVKGLLGAGKQYLTVEMGNPADEGLGIDYEHNLSMDLTTGTFVVECSLRVNRNDIAEKWDEVKTIASLTGEDDVLMAFAKEYVRKENKQRTQKIVRERKP